jgi:hypothetical protein
MELASRHAYDNDESDESCGKKPVIPFRSKCNKPAACQAKVYVTFHSDPPEYYLFSGCANE